MAQKSDLSDIIRPMHIISIVFFLSPYISRKNKSGEKAFKFNIFLFLINISGLIFYLSNEIPTLIYSFMKYEDYEVETLIIVTLMMVITYYSVMISSSNFMHQRATRFLNHLSEVDQAFDDLSLCPNDNTPKRVIYALAAYEILSLCSIFIYGFILGAEISIRMAYFIYRHVLSHVRMTIFSIFASYTFMLYYRFNLLNDQLLVYKALYEDASPMLRKRIVSCIKTCCTIHELLTMSCRLLNKAFDVQLTATFISSFWFIVSVLNLLLKDDDVFRAFNYTALNCLKCIILMMGMFLIALACTKTQNKARKTSLLLAYLAEEELKKCDENYVHLKCIQMLGRKVEFNACGFSPIELPMICTLFISISTYLIILNQFNY